MEELPLDLINFHLDGAERSRYVLTSPRRSLQSCARFRVKPVELLLKSLNELIAEQNDAPSEVVRVMHESYDKERTKLLQMCRGGRERIILEAGSRWPGHRSKDLGLEGVPNSKPKDHAKDFLYADLCYKRKSMSRLSCSTAGNRHPDRNTVCSFSLGDLRHSPATEMELERITKDIRKKMCVTVSERDCKIAALMLVRHQEEQESMKRCQREEQERQEACRQEEAHRAQAEKERREKLKESMQRWHEMLRTRKRMRQQCEEEKAKQLEQEVLMHKEQWRRMKAEVVAQRREKMEAAHKEASGRKRYQEKLLREKEEARKTRHEKERQVGVEREQKARRSKEMQEQRKRRWLEEANRQELLRRILLKHRVEQQAEEEEAQVRKTIERNLQHACEKHSHAIEARLRKLRERAYREEEQIQKARVKARLQEVQQLAHKRILLQLSQRRMDRAAAHVSALYGARAQHTQQHNTHRLLCHRMLRERLLRDEEAQRKIREHRISVKEARRERLRKQWELMQEEAHRSARASFRMREEVRQQTHRRTFDQMVREAQLIASLRNMKV